MFHPYSELAKQVKQMDLYWGLSNQLLETLALASQFHFCGGVSICMAWNSPVLNWAIEE
jgi:hypothetical protein